MTNAHGLRTMRNLSAWMVAGLLCLPMAISSPVGAVEWQDSECRADKDDGGHAVKVCRDGESIGIFWEDDSYVNGWCDDRAYEIEYSGIEKSDALSWVDHFCG